MVRFSQFFNENTSINRYFLDEALTFEKLKQLEGSVLVCYHSTILSDFDKVLNIDAEHSTDLGTINQARSRAEFQFGENGVKQDIFLYSVPVILKDIDPVLREDFSSEIEFFKGYSIVAYENVGEDNLDWERNQGRDKLFLTLAVFDKKLIVKEGIKRIDVISYKDWLKSWDVNDD